MKDISPSEVKGEKMSKSIFYLLSICTLFNLLIPSEAKARKKETAAFALVFNDPGITRNVSSHYMKTNLKNSYDQLDIVEPENKDLSSYSKEELQALGKKLSDSLKKNRAVDLFVVAHTNAAYMVLDYVRPSYLKKKIRMVYNTGCYNAHHSTEWKKRDVTTYIGHAGLSCSPIFLKTFLSKWTNGYNAKDAAYAGNLSLAMNLGGLTLTRDEKNFLQWSPAYRKWLMNDLIKKIKTPDFASVGSLAGTICDKIVANGNYGKAFRQSFGHVFGNKKIKITSKRPRGYFDKYRLQNIVNRLSNVDTINAASNQCLK